MYRLKRLETQIWNTLARAAARTKAGRRRLGPPIPSASKQPQSLLFLCTGNICRSPYAEHALRRALDARGIEGFEIRSAGLSTTPGKAADPQAVKAASARGICLASHRTVSATEELLGAADLILFMQPSHARLLRRDFPDARPKAGYLGALGLTHGLPLVIDDPYGRPKEEFERCLDRIDRCVELLAENLSGVLKT